MTGTRRHTALIVCLLLAVAGLLAGQLSRPTPAHALGNGTQLTPPMAWDPWNYIKATGQRNACTPNNNTYNEAYFKSIADAMVSSGLSKVGYNTVLLACGPEYRDSNGNLQSEPGKFPNGGSIPELISYIHSKGLKAEVYTDGGNGSCIGGIGSYDHKTQDAQTWARWGADAVKIDWCGGDAEHRDGPSTFAAYRDAIAATGHAMWIEACLASHNDNWVWAGSSATMWRTTSDIDDNWSSVMAHVDGNQHPDVSGPGHYNYADMLEVGVQVGAGGLTDTEAQAEFSMWSIMSSPLVLGNDIRSMTPATKATLTNPEVIAVDQDALGAQGVLVANSNGLQTYVKRLAGTGTRAVALLNRNTSAANMTVNWAQLGLTNASASVRDLWARADRGSYSGSYTVNVPAHGAAMLKITGASTTETTADDAGPGWTYSGSWSAVSGHNDGRYAGTSHYSNHTGDTATFSFTGSHAAIHLIDGPANGVLGVSIDGGTQFQIDTYWPITRNDDPVLDITRPSGGNHTVTLRVLGTKNSSSTNTYVNIDRAIYSP